MKKILLLADPNSAHTQKWAKSLADKGFNIYIVGLNDCNSSIYQAYPNIKIYTIGFDPGLTKQKNGSVEKLKYFLAIPKFRKLLKEINPDIVHAHYATSYGVLGALSGFHPFYISVWGSDVFGEQNKRFPNKYLVRFNLAIADKIFSTSHVMAREIKKHTSKEPCVIPFGVDTEQFKPHKEDFLFDKNAIVIGTVKSLKPIYRIDDLIQAFWILKTKHPDLPLKLLIVGGGEQEQGLKEMVEKLGLEGDTVFTGSIDHDILPGYYNMFDIFVVLSESESFGVAVIEAGACEKPVVVSNAGGLPEVVENGVTGFVVPVGDPGKASEMIEKLIMDKSLRTKMGQAGRERVIQMYQWKNNLDEMIKVYNN